MSSSGPPAFETILKLCRQAAPEPWFPAEFAAAMGADLRRLEAPLDDLRAAGLIEPTEFDHSRGQGFRLTRLGESALKDPQALAAMRNGREETDEVEVPARPVKSEVLAALANDRKPCATYALFAANVIVFLVGMSIAMAGNWQNANVRWFFMAGNAHARHATGAVTAADIDDGQWWRLLTSPFVHQDFFHLLINMSTFMAYGRRGEQIWGRWRYLLIYLVSGFTGSCAALWHDPAISPIGASPAVCGVLLSLAAWFGFNARHLPRGLGAQGMRKMIGAFVWLVAWWGLLSWLGGAKFLWVSFTAGGVAGALLALPLLVQGYTTFATRWAFPILAALVPILGVGLVVQAKQKNPEWPVVVAVQRKARVQQQQNAVQEQKKNREKGDFDKFNQDLLPPTKKASAFITEHWPAIKNLCEQEAGDRDKDEVAGARQKLQEARQQTDAALAAIQAGGALKVERVVDAVSAAESYLKEQKKLLEMVERCLSGAKWTDKEREEMDDQARTTRAMWKKLDRLLG